MSCHEVEQRFAEIVSGDLPSADRVELERHLDSCGHCRRELAKLRPVWNALGTLVEEAPSPALAGRFYAMLAGFEQAAAAPRRGLFDLGPLLQDWWPRRPVWQLGLSLGLLLAGAVLGARLVPGPADPELGKLRSEVATLSRLMSLSLLEQSSASERLRGVSYSRRGQGADPEVVDALLAAVTGDPDVNVRLAAVDALAALHETPAVRDGLQRALLRQDAPLVQLALVDLLLEHGDPDSRSAIRRLRQQAGLDETVRNYLERRLDREI